MGEIKTTPSVYVVQFRKNIEQPSFYTLSHPTSPKMKLFINDLKNGKRKAEVFSEQIEEDYPQYYNESTRKVTRNSFSTFLTDNRERDSVILFYNSKVPKNTGFLNHYL